MPFDLSSRKPQRVAVIGGGIAGLSAAWLLSKEHRVTLYEASPKLGGHARTVLAGRNGDRPVDTGFIVFNFVNYPRLTALFRELDVPIQRSDMSFGVSLGGGRLEYALHRSDAVFGQRRNLLRPAFHGMLRDIFRFNSRAESLAAGKPDLTVDDLIGQLGLGTWFREAYLLPICGSIWSTPARQIGSFPAESLVRFMRNHALMSATGQHQWWTVSGGSQSYVSRLATALERRGVALRPASPVEKVVRGPEAVNVRVGGTEVEFDQVIFACHADQALALIDRPTRTERSSLGAVRFQTNRVVLHRDPSVMPDRKRCWASWVFRDDPQAPRSPINVSYWMNRLQNIPVEDPLFVTLNPAHALRDDAIYDEVDFRHPVFDHGALVAQDAIAGMQGLNRTWFAGAWLRNGFHEDGFASAARIERQMSMARA